MSVAPSRIPTAVDRLLEFWRSSGTPFGPPCKASDIRAIEERCGVAFPTDLRDYFLRVNGSADSPDDFFHTWRSIREFVPASEESWGEGLINAARTFVLCDWAINCWAYGIRLSRDASEPAPVVMISGRSPTPVADTFAEFLDMAINDQLPPR
jgi:hypothetical protein